VVTDLPTWYPDPDEAKPAPMPLLRVQAFLNTLDLEQDVDRLEDPRSARNWLIDAGLVGQDRRVSTTELVAAREVRDCLRSLLEPGACRDAGASAGVPAEDLEALRSLAADHCARLTVGDGGALAIECAPADRLGDGLFELLLIIRGAQEDGSWSRLKMCANPDCQWVFYDRSRNQQGNWCDMAVCGNRLKNRQLRARRR
jgi:predicted RNA-binding Zn ribbon-like protein